MSCPRYLILQFKPSIDSGLSYMFIYIAPLIYTPGLLIRKKRITPNYNILHINYCQLKTIVTTWQSTQETLNIASISTTFSISSCVADVRPNKMEVYINGGTLKWMVYNGTSYKNGWFGGTPISGNPQHFCSKSEDVDGTAEHASNGGMKRVPRRTNWDHQYNHRHEFMTNTANMGNTRQENNQDGKHTNFLLFQRYQPNLHLKKSKTDWKPSQ